MGTKSQIIYGKGTAYIGVAGSRGTTELGFTTEGFRLTVAGMNRTDIKPHEMAMKYGSVVDGQEVHLLAEGFEFTLPLMQDAIAGSAQADDRLTMSALSEDYVSVRFVGHDEGSKYLEIWLPYCQSVGDIDLALSALENRKLPLDFEAYDRHATINPLNVMYFTDIEVDTAVFAYAAGISCYRVDGEDSAADVLTTVTGGASGDVLVIVPASATAAITITDDGTSATADAFVAASTGNIVLDHAADMAVFVRNATQWVESYNIQVT